MNATRRCSCGITMLGGLCAHCDRPRICAKGCPACLIRASLCNVCRLNIGSPTARIAHENQCRDAEVQRERGTA